MSFRTFRNITTVATTAVLVAACGQSPSDKTEATDTSATESDLLNRINNGGTINVGTEGTYPPYTYHDEQDNLTGYDVEVTRAVADKLGVKVEFKETQWDAMLAGLDAKRFDMVANQVALTTPERQAKYDIAEPYNWSGAAILAPKSDSRYNSWESLKGLKSAQSLSSNYGELAQKYEAEVVPVDGMAQAIELVKQGRADVTLNDHLAILDYLNKFPNSDLEVKLVAPAEEKTGAGIVMLKGNDEVLAKVDAAMKELHEDGTLSELSQQFFGADITKR